MIKMCKHAKLFDIDLFEMTLSPLLTGIMEFLKYHIESIELIPINAGGNIPMILTNIENINLGFSEGDIFNGIYIIDESTNYHKRYTDLELLVQDLKIIKETRS